MSKRNLMNEFDAAEYLGGLSVGTLRTWRYKGEGMKFIKMGRRVLYDQADLDAFIDENKKNSTCGQAGVW